MNTFALLMFTLAGTPDIRTPSSADYPPAIRTVLESTQTLRHPRGKRLPLFLWTVQGGVVEDTQLQQRIIQELDERGVAMIASWNPDQRERSLADALRIARIQQEHGLLVCVNATACMYGFFNGDDRTAHVDGNGRPFFDGSIPGGKIGCPFRIEHRYGTVTDQIEGFVSAYQRAGVPLDFVFGDWEIDGPLEINRAWESAKRCAVCRASIAKIDDFREFQKAVRLQRAEATRTCYVKPILARYPNTWVGNYGVYPHDGYRYWFDYFEEFVDYHPYRREQRARYREWFQEFPWTGYTCAMPVVYPWARVYGWYDFANPDYRWFYNTLLVASNAPKHVDPRVPIVPFVHWHTIFDPDPPDASLPQMSEQAYRELLWHMLLRGSDTFFLWCLDSQAAAEIALVHQVWSEALEYADWLEDGEPITFDVPSNEQPIVSGLRRGSHVLVRRTDFDRHHPDPVILRVAGKTLSVPSSPGRCLIVPLESPDR
ncbi:MAG: hypothetical protein HY000_30555 [Planctomycetes bacterium]|nr:hypothetical protein [Planctomycetota bacterium]